jgi:hypothetical protein
MTCLIHLKKNKTMFKFTAKIQKRSPHQSHPEEKTALPQAQHTLLVFQKKQVQEFPGWHPRSMQYGVSFPFRTHEAHSGQLGSVILGAQERETRRDPVLGKNHHTHAHTHTHTHTHTHAQVVVEWLKL